MTTDSFFQNSKFQFPPVLKTKLVIVDLDDVDTWTFAVHEDEFSKGHVVYHQQVTGEYGFFYQLETEEDALQLMCYFKSLGQRAIQSKDNKCIGNTWDGRYMEKTLGGFSFLQSRK